MSDRRPKIFFLFLILLLIIYAIVLLRTAWMCDDAYITLRTVDNFVNGYGLTWNVSERVQAYTHPLWMFIISFFYLFTHQAFLTTIIISMVVSMGAILIFAFRIAPSNKTAMLGMLAFILSKFFVDYSTSGLENPLTHILLALFFMNYFSESHSEKRLVVLTFFTSLLMLTRLDLILLVLPALWYQVRQKSFGKVLPQLIVGFLPLIVWEIFSFWYYGSLVSNTTFAKLNTGLSHWDVLAQGSHYLEAALRGDRLMILVILAAVGLTIWRKGRAGWPLSLGILLYMAGVTYGGGCFMGGRFFTGPLLVAVILLSRYDHLIASTKNNAMTIAIILMVGMISYDSPLYSGSHYGLDKTRGLGYDIDDNRLLNFQSTGLWTAGGWRTEPDHPWVEKGKRYRSETLLPVVEGGIGFMGYYSGPGVHIVDMHALADPLLARMPTAFDVMWRIGHFKRAIPEGYIETIARGENQIIDVNLARYYDSLKYVVSGPLWNWRRIMTAAKLNLGVYDHFLDGADELLISIHHRDLAPTVADGTSWAGKYMHVFPTRGIIIYLDSVWQADTIEISLDGNDNHAIVFAHGQDSLSQVSVGPDSQTSGGSVTYTIGVPDVANIAGYDRLIVSPVSGDGVYALGHVAPIAGSGQMDE
jgi:arabinofuranosyltransferase